MADTRTVGQLTLHTLRYIVNDYTRNRFMKEANSPDDIKKIVWDSVRPTILTDEDKVAFLKGIKLCDFDALYEWKVNNMNK